MKYKKGQYVIARYLGKGGDLVVGIIESVRQNAGGRIIGKNLLTGASFNKTKEGLDIRNVVCKKRQADRIIKAYRDNKEDRGIAQKIAVAIAEGIKPTSRRKAVIPTQTVLPFDKGVPLAKDLLVSFKRMSTDEQQIFLRSVMGSTLKIFGIE